jgi:hypothetical protein
LTTWKHNYDYEHLLTFLERRRMQHLHPVPLESFHLELCENEFDQATPRPTPSIFLAFEKLMAEGLDIQVSTRHSRWPGERMYMGKEGLSFESPQRLIHLDSCEYYPERTEYLAPQV